MNRRLSPFNIVSLVAGFAFLYIPILLLILVVPIMFFQRAQARAQEEGR